MFFVKQKTAYEMRISDWSSDVCSSDLTAHIEQKDAQKSYEGTDWSKQSDRVKHVVQSCFNGRRLVVFSGGAAKGADAVYQDARDIRDGGGNGSIIGRNTFQRPRDERSEEHTSELQSLMRTSYAVFCLKKKNNNKEHNTTTELNKS